MKKAQMELIGIAIVVVLISLGMLFMLSFGISKKGTSIKEDFTIKEMVSNTLSTLLRVKAYGCGDLTIEDLLQDCFTSKSISCGTDDESEEPPPNSCEYVKGIAEEIFEKTFYEWGRSYFLDISKDEELPEIQLHDGKNCTGTGELIFEEKRWHDKIVEDYWIPLDPGTIHLRLGMCSNLYKD